LFLVKNTLKTKKPYCKNVLINIFGSKAVFFRRCLSTTSL